MEIVSRSGWKAKPATATPVPMKLPVSRVYLHHSVSQVTNDPAKDMLALQRIGFGRGFSDVSYSWCFHPDGTILEGRGKNIGAHTEGKNSTSFGFCLIGDYSSRVVTPAQINAIRWLASELQIDGALKPGIYPTAGHRELKPTLCPGDWAMQRLVDMRVPWEDPVTDPEMIQAAAPVVALVPTPSGDGYWIVCEDGAVYSFGDAVYHGRVLAPTR